MIGRSFIMLMVLLAPLRTVFGVLEGDTRSPDSSLLRRGRDLLETCDCDDFNDYTLDTCNETEGCIYTCIDDGNACTTQSFEVDNCVPQDIDVAAVCDDLDDKTFDSCSADVGCIHTTCDDGNECTDDIWDDIQGQCVFKTKICDDDKAWTLDICLPSGGGCKFLDFSSVDDKNFESYFETNIASLPEDTYYYDDATSLSGHKIDALLNWINKKVVLTKTPYCYKQSYGRGAGEVLTTCPKPKQKLGALCYSPCQSGYSRQGTLDCQQECKAGWRDDGLFCRKTEYGRGAGFPWKFGDPLNNSKMFKRCEAVHGRGNCEKWGAVVYPKCKPGYYAAGCCICRPPVPDCAREGYKSPGFDLSCPVKIVMGDPTPLICANGLEQDGALCYPPCKAGYDGVGPVCWQVCDGDGVDCGIGCAQDSGTCASATVDMILGPLIVAANIGTLGLSSVPTAAARTITVGAKIMKYTDKVGFALLKLAEKLQPKNASSLTKKATLIKRATGSIVEILDDVNSAYGRYELFAMLYADMFSDVTSPEINDRLNQALGRKDAVYIKRLWATLQFNEIQAAEGWNIAQTTLTVASMVDVTGITGAIAAYTNPKCLDVVPFPAI